MDEGLAALSEREQVHPWDLSRFGDQLPSFEMPPEVEPPQRVHWDNEFTTRLLGLPGAYDLGPERCAWLIQVVTDWMGDAGHLARLECRYLKFNYMGDATWLRGSVTDKFERDGKAFVKCAVECVNHREEVTAAGTVEVELPRR